MVSSSEFKRLPLSNDFIFGEVMRREHLCKLFLEELLQKEIARIEYIDKQKELSDSYLSHGVRLDVYLRDSDNTVYDVEMQTVNNYDLERRTRYYQGAIDRDTLEKGVYYSNLPDSYVIFICTFDYYGAGDMVYERVSHINGRPELPYVDGSHSLFLNCCYDPAAAPQNAIREFLDYIKTNSDDAVYESALANEARRTTEEVRSDAKKEVAYMTYQMKMMDERMAGIREGEQRGLQKGMQAGMQKGKQAGMQEARVDSLIALMKGTGWSALKAMDAIGIPASEQPMYAALLENQ